MTVITGCSCGIESSFLKYLKSSRSHYESYFFFCSGLRLNSRKMCFRPQIYPEKCEIKLSPSVYEGDFFLAAGERVGRSPRGSKPCVLTVILTRRMVSREGYRLFMIYMSFCNIRRNPSFEHTPEQSLSTSAAAGLWPARTACYISLHTGGTRIPVLL